MAALDLKKTYKHLYAPSAKASAVVDVPPMTFLMVDGAGDPNTAPDYVVAIEALYTLSYTLKFALKREGLDYAVMPLEGLWWAEDMTQFRMDERTQLALDDDDRPARCDHGGALHGRLRGRHEEACPGHDRPGAPGGLPRGPERAGAAPRPLCGRGAHD